MIAGHGRTVRARGNDKGGRGHKYKGAHLLLHLQGATPCFGGALRCCFMSISDLCEIAMEPEAGP